MRQPNLELAYALAPTIEDAMHPASWRNRSALSNLTVTSRPNFERFGRQFLNHYVAFPGFNHHSCGKCAVIGVGHIYDKITLPHARPQKP